VEKEQRRTERFVQIGAAENVIEQRPFAEHICGEYVTHISVWDVDID